MLPNYTENLFQKGLPAIVIIYNKHTHSTNTADALASLPALAEIRQIFEDYFNDGMGITESINYHVNKMELEANEDALANASLNPKYRTVRYWYDKWRQENLGPRFGSGMLEVIFSARNLDTIQINSC